jgi:hypothetical protein
VPEKLAVAAVRVPVSVGLAERTTVVPVPVEEAVINPLELSKAAIVEAVTELKIGWSVKVCTPLQVGTIACDRAGEASERMAVVAEPLTAESPTEALGFAKPENVPGRSED